MIPGITEITDAKTLAQAYYAVDGSRNNLALAVWMTLSFIYGEQWVKRSMSRGIIPISNPTNEIRATHNIMLPIFRFRQEAMGRERPVMVAHEGGRDLDDAEMAQVSSRIAAYWEEQNGLSGARQRAFAWCEVGGMSFIEPYWRERPTGTIKMRRKFTGKPAKDDDGSISFSENVAVPEMTGDVKFRVYNIMQVTPLPLSADNWEDVSALIISDLIDESQLRRYVDCIPGGKMPTKEQLVSCVTTPSLTQSWMDRINTDPLSGLPFGAYGGDNSLAADTVRYLVIQYRERPSKEHPNGRLMVTCGEFLIFEGELPYIEEARKADPYDTRNISMGLCPMSGIYSPGRIIPPAFMGSLIPFQTQVNNLLTDQSQSRRANRPRTFIGEDALADKQKLTDEIGQVIKLRPGAAPPITTQAVVMPGLNEEIAMWIGAGFKAGGMPPILQGQSSPNVRSAFQAAQEKEEAQGDLRQAAGRIEGCMTDVIKMALAIMRSYGSIEQVQRIYGEDHAGDVNAWWNGNLQTDVRVQTGSLAPRNYATIQYQIYELIKVGAFHKADQSPLDLKKIWKMLRLGTTNPDVEGDELQIAAVDRENARIMRGEMFGPNPWDNHILHAEHHRNYMQRREYANATEDVRTIFAAHLLAHEAKSAQIMSPGDLPMGLPEPPPPTEEEVPDANVV